MYEVIPRGPIYYSESDGLTPDLTQNYNEKMEEWRSAAKDEAFRTARMNVEMEQVPKYIQWLQGQQWDQRRPRYRSKFFDNRLEKARFDNLSLLTNSRPTIDCFANNQSLDKTAKIIQKVIQTEWMRRDMDLSLVMVTDIAMLWGTGFWKIGAAMPGYMKVTPCGPDNVMPIQPGWDIQQSAAVLYRTWKSPSYFYRTFPFCATGIERQASYADANTFSARNRPSQMDEYTWNALSPQMKKIIGLKNVGTETPARSFNAAVELQEYYVDDQSVNESNKQVLMRDPYMRLDEHNYWYWVPPKARLYPRKRLIVYGGRKKVYDGPAPFWHGLYPFGCLRLNPVPWSFWGLSDYRDLLPINQAINEIVAGTLDMIKRCLNPTAVTKEGAIPQPAWNNFFADMPGAKLRMGPLSNPSTDFRYMENPQLPNYVFEALVRFLMPEFDKISGQIDLNTMMGKKQIPGGDTIEQMRDTQQTATQLKGRYQEGFLRDSGLQAVSNVCQFYTGRTRMHMLGTDGITGTDWDYDPQSMVPHDLKQKEAFWTNFGITVKPGSMHSGAKDRDRQMALALFKMGAISRAQVLRTFDFANIEEIEAELKTEALMRQTGGIPPEMLEQLQNLMNLSGRGPLPDAGGGGDTPRLSRGARTGVPTAA